MSSSPFFSIVVPTYNREHFIVRTLQSLLSINYSQFEIIVVDDGSTDNTELVVNQIKDSRLAFYKKPNAERAAARNFGARHAKGDYVNFFDSDDLAYPNHLETAARAVSEFASPEIFHQGYDVKDADGVLIRSAADWPKTINKHLINGNHLSCNGVFLRSDIARQFPFNEIRALSASEDFELWLRLAARFPIYCMNGVTSTVVNHDARSVLTINLPGLLKRIELLRSSLLQDEKFCSQYLDQISGLDASFNYYIALHSLLANYPKSKAIPYLIKAVQARPTTIFSRQFLAIVKKLLL